MILERPLPFCSSQDHHSEVLNRICIDLNCPNNALVCIMCEDSEHFKHLTVPVKTLWTQSGTDNGKIFKDSFQIDVEQSRLLQALHSLRLKLNRMIDDVEDQAATYFQSVGGQLSQYVNLQSPQDAMKTLNGDHLKKYFKEYLRLAHLGEAGSYSLNKKVDLIMKAVQSQVSTAIESLAKAESGMAIKVAETEQLLKLPNLNSLAEVQFKWDPELHSSKITILNKIAEQTSVQTCGQRFALISPAITGPLLTVKKRVSWAIKIKKNPGWIGVGICLKNIIIKSKYFFNYTTLGHGSYLISGNGFSWSHSLKQFNSVSKSFPFSVGDIVIVEYDSLENMIRFKKLHSDKSFSMPVITLPPNESYHPCVNLANPGDSVQIVDLSAIE